MNELRPSSDARSLLALAKSDGPSHAVRTRMWAGVSSSVGVAGGALSLGNAGADGAAASGWAAAAKMLTLGTLLGGPLTIGIALAVLRVGPAPASPSDVSHVAAVAAAPARVISFIGEREPSVVAPNAPIGGLLEGATAAGPRVAGVDGVAAVQLAPLPAEPALAVAETQAPESVKPVKASPLASPSQARYAGPARTGDLLAREANLVAAGRAALKRGDAKRALAAIHAAQALASHQLAPEELAVEIQSLHALGREREAVQAEVVLKVSYPESDLTR